MSDAPKLNSCGCCEGIPSLSAEQNAPGLPALAYRLGTYATFLRRMLSEIQSPGTLTNPPAAPWALSALTTRSSDDPAVALLDAFAVVADVLTFYQERIVNEGYLRTATERLSVLELARAIGYELNPGVAAGTYLAFTVEDVIGSAVAATLPQTPKTPSAGTQGAPTFNFGSVLVPKGSKVQSIPPQNKLPQMFETAADLFATKDWNILLPRLTRPADLALTAGGGLYLLGVRAAFPPGTPVTSLTPFSAYLLNPETPPLSGTVPGVKVDHITVSGSVSLKRGDRILLAGRNGFGATLALVFLVRNVHSLAALGQTRINFADHPADPPFAPATFPPGSVPAVPVAFNQANVDKFVLRRSIDESDLEALMQISGWTPGRLATAVNNLSAAPVSDQGLFTFGASAAFFGHNAQPWKSLTKPTALRDDPFPLNWDAANSGAGRLIWTDSQGEPYPDADVFLERTFPQVVANGWAAFESAAVGRAVYRINSVLERSLADYGLSGKATGLSLGFPSNWHGLGPGAPSAVSWAANRLDVFTLGFDRHLYHEAWNGSGWFGPEDLGGGNLVNSPSAVSWAANRLDVFAIGSDGHLYHKAWNGSGWFGPEDLGGGNLINSPSAVSWAANRLDVFAIGSDGHLYHKAWNGSAWFGPEDLAGGNLVNSPSAVSWSANRLDVFAVGSDGHLYHKGWNGLAWFGPEDLGGSLNINSPSAVSWAANRLDVFTIGSDATLWHKAWDGSNWSGFEALGNGILVDSPSAVSWAPNRLDIFALGSDANLYHKFWNGSSWGGLENLGGSGNLTSSPSAVSWAANRLDIFTTGSVGHLMHKFWAPGWGGPEDLGQGSMPPPFLVRKTTAWLQSDQQTLAELPVTSDIPAGSTSLMLNGMVLGLKPGRMVALNGTRADAAGVVENEVLVLDDIVHNGGFTTLEFTTGLQFSYLRQTVTVNASVVPATHGETIAVPEVLGSGDASQTNQTFTFKRSPLTYVAAPTPSGSTSTLEIRVNDLLWEEVPSLYGAGPDDRVYITRRNDDGTTTVMFGDGIAGLRLPNGQNNVTAVYRVGIGPDGDVDAGSLTVLQSRPPGVRSAINPLPATGGAGPENLDSARSNAPLTVLTLDRIVSLEDYEDFASAFAGIGKAQAVPFFDGETGLVHLTVAGVAGAAVDPVSRLFRTLVAGIDSARDPVQQVRIASYRPALFNLAAKVLLDPTYISAAVLTAVHSALLAAFSFESRAFGQPATAAEVIATIQAVPGIVATDLDKLYRTDDFTGPFQTVPASVLPASFAVRQGAAILPAELLLINPIGIAITERQ
jgi:hypothetical protein